jgi:hypothetical protein
LRTSCRTRPRSIRSFCLVHQYNEFALPDEGWNAQTTDDTEPANDGILDGAVRAVRQLLQRYRTATAP